MIKKQQPADIKLLHKKFKFIDKPNIAILYEFCDEDYQKTEKILIMSKEVKNPKSIIKLLLEKPQRGQALLSSFQKRYDDELKLRKRDQKKQGNQIQKITQDSLNFFKYIPQDTCLSIFLFLDPYSTVSLSTTCKKLRRVYNMKPFSQYYRLLCINLFQKYQPSLPENTRFLRIKAYVLKNANLLGPNAQHAVVHNLRKYIWGDDIKVDKEPASYYQTFGGYKQLYFNAPRVNFNGFYFWKHEYRKEEQKDLLKNAGNVHFIKYYRYIRFFADGSVITAVLPSKHKKQALLPYLSHKNLQIPTAEEQKWKQVMIGQYVAKRDSLQLRVFKSGSIFLYSFKIVSISKLMLLSYKLKVIDKNEILQTLIDGSIEKPIYFQYFPHSGLAYENSGIIRSSSL